ncbi:hypothetical protein [Flavobacterium suzhouense]|uniref:Uncharacterized protein n=1 Tax=Flavobacterium suzhouense TaxID=1529638 RepID=A0ABW5NW20_9FLAO
MEINERIRLNQSFLIAEDGKFLGKLSLSKYDLESISNDYGLYGSRYSLSSIKNPYGLYGSIYGLQSPNNPYSLSPPHIYLRGVKCGYLTKNKYKLGNNLDPDSLDSWMKRNNLNY